MLHGTFGCRIYNYGDCIGSKDALAGFGSIIGLPDIKCRSQPHGWKVAIEFRHPSWYIGEVYEMADEYACSIVLHDIPKSANRRLNKKAAFAYLRFHGPIGDYRGGYSDDYLQQQAEQITSWRKEGKDVYVYFNNTIGDAIKNVMTLNNMVSFRAAGSPPPEI
jgi:uncharacterized protein YecE (DUF72 family)